MLARMSSRTPAIDAAMDARVDAADDLDAAHRPDADVVADPGTPPTLGQFPDRYLAKECEWVKRCEGFVSCDGDVGWMDYIRLMQAQLPGEVRGGRLRFDGVQAGSVSPTM